MKQAITISRLAGALGWAGIIPFVALSIAGAFPPAFVNQSWAIHALALYGALILSFLGGATWGLTLARDDASASSGLVVGIAASLAGFAGALAPNSIGFALMIAGFVAMLAYDLGLIARGLLPQWYRSLRIGLSVAAVGSLAFALAFGA